MSASTNSQGTVIRVKTRSTQSDMDTLGACV